MSDSPYTRMTREEQAEAEVGTTAVSRGLCILLVLGFLLTAVSVPIIQHIIEIRAGFLAKGHWVWPNVYEALTFPGEAVRAFRDPAHQGLWNRFQAANTKFMQKVSTFETALEEDSFLARSAIPHTQALTATFFGLGNEQVYLGRGGWLFYQPEVAYLTDSGFLSPSILEARSRAGHAGEEVQPDPVKAIVAFRDDLRARGIHLILLPAPVKPMIEPERLSARYSTPLPIPLQNPSYAKFLDELKKAGVDYLDVSQALATEKEKSKRPQFLTTDTHWTPGAMDLAAELLAKKIIVQDPSSTTGSEWERTEATVAGAGDISAMLKLPPGSKLYPTESVTIHPVRSKDGALWKPDHSAQVLLLGDSFSNIYSLGAMGWGEAAGFAEQVSFYLQRPLDAILRNDAGAYATREILARDLAQGRDRLAGKKVLVWEFAMRELAVGDWKLIPLPAATPAPAGSESTTFFAPAPGESFVVEGVVRSRSTVPTPGTVPYKDQIFAVHLTGLSGSGVPAGSSAVIYLSGMADNKLTPAAGWKDGEKVRLRLRSWDDVAAAYERLNRSELSDETLQLETPSWGEPITAEK
jgi:hypothetical protein